MDAIDTSLAAGVLREDTPGERRVALTPDGVTRLQALGFRVVVEHGAGDAAGFRDADYVVAGATSGSRDDVLGADVIVCISAPPAAATDRIGEGRLLLGMLGPGLDLERATALADAKVTTVTFERLPRTLSRAQSLDALTSQANVAGYKAVLVAADTYAGFFPMLMTAAGTTRPAAVLVLGAGVAGLQAIATAKRLGAQVTGYDVRDEAKGDVASLGATFLELGGISASGAGGYARVLTPEETQAQQEAMAEAISRFDVVICTAQVPGRKPPVLIPAAALSRLGNGAGPTPRVRIPPAALSRLGNGAVVIDLAAGPFGGNVEGSVPDSTIVTDRGV